LFILNLMPEPWMASSKWMDGAGPGAELSLGNRLSPDNARTVMTAIRSCLASRGNVFALASRFHGDQRVPVVRHGNRRRIDVLARERLTEVVMRRASLVPASEESNAIAQR
jgi:hypothetical protein